jgi:hypothetical protein
MEFKRKGDKGERATTRRDCVQLAISPTCKFHRRALLDRATQRKLPLRIQLQHRRDYRAQRPGAAFGATTLLCARQARRRR